MALEADQILIEYLETVAAITDIAEEILGETPPKIKRPWVRVTLLDDPSTDRNVDWLIKADLQIDCFAGTPGGTQLIASELSNAVREAIFAMPEADVDGAVVTSATARRRRNDDQAFKPPMPCYVVSTTIHMHP